MDRSYPITYHQQCIGSAKMHKEGLYMQIRCVCRFPDKQIYKLYASCNNQQIELGIPIPKNLEFVLEKRIPIKQLSDTEVKFYAKRKNNALPAEGIPVSADCPFERLADLHEGAYLQHTEGTLKIVIAESINHQP